MSSRILVCPPGDDPLSRLSGQTLVVRVEDPADVPRSASAARRDNALHALWLASNRPLSAIPLSDSWRDIPLAIHASGLGDVQELADRLPLLRTLDVRVYLPAGDSRSVLAHRILSSLQVATALVFSGSVPDWEAVADLLQYATYGTVPHAPIDPFDHVMDHYRSDALTDFGRVYLDDPSRYLHLDAEGRIALRRRDLLAGDFVDCALDGSDIDAHPAYLEDRESWRKAFLEPRGCAWCPAWRVCQGKFTETPGPHSCRTVFTELMDSADHHRASRERARQRWQP